MRSCTSRRGGVCRSISLNPVGLPIALPVGWASAHRPFSAFEHHGQLARRNREDQADLLLLPFRQVFTERFPDTPLARKLVLARESLPDQGPGQLYLAVLRRIQVHFATWEAF